MAQTKTLWFEEQDAFEVAIQVLEEEGLPYRVADAKNTIEVTAEGELLLTCGW